jgi:hypothetical protein
MDLRDAHRGVELTDLGDSVRPVNLNPWVFRLRMDVEENTVRPERVVNSMEGVDDARGSDASKGPGKHCDVERRLGEFNRGDIRGLEDQFRLECGWCVVEGILDPHCIEIKRKHGRGLLSKTPGETSLA